MLVEPAEPALEDRPLSASTEPRAARGRRATAAPLAAVRWPLLRARLRRPAHNQIGGISRVWLLTGTLAVFGLLVAAGAIPPGTVGPGLWHIPWWALVAAFYLVEALVLQFHFRGEAHSYTLSEIPLVLGLFFAAPAEIVFGQALGAGLALALHRRQSPMKLLFNLSQYFAGTALAVAVFHGIAPVASGAAPAQWLAAFSATMLASALTSAAISTAIWVAVGRWTRAELRTVTAFSLGVAFTNTSLALIAVTILRTEPAALWLCAVPVGLVLICYRAYISEREKHARLEFLYESARILQQSRELGPAVVSLLQHARSMFRADTAELVLFPLSGGQAPLRTVLGPGQLMEVMAPVEEPSSDPIRERAMHENQPFLIVRAGGLRAGGLRTGGLRAGRPNTETRDAIMTPLRGERGVLGTLLLTGRLGDSRPFRTDDLQLLEALGNHAAVALENGQLGQSLTHLHEVKEQLRYQAFHDSLTGLGNRTLFLERLGEALAQRDASGRIPVVLFVDLDDFKTVNDRLGHAAGDALLVAVAERLRACLRPSDIAVRLGGDEFAILLQDSVELEAALGIAGRVMEQLGLPFKLHGDEVSIRASVGVAGSRSPDESADVLLRNADVAMYTAKARGKGRFAVFEDSMEYAISERHAAKADLHGAVGRDEFVLHYQPIATLSSGAITGVEALVRWRHPRRGLVKPVDFIALAEETGLIVPIGRWVLEEACRQAHAWQERAPEAAPLTIAVNLSARQLHQPGFVEDVARILRAANLRPERLMLEFTESLVMQDVPETAEKLRALKELGVKLALDNFGHGPSSLGSLRRVPVDALKIARTFVDAGDLVNTDREFARAVVGVGRALDLTVVAEGIERSDQLDRLRELGFESGQGFFFARPVDERALLPLLDGRVLDGRALAGVTVGPVSEREDGLWLPGGITRRAFLEAPAAYEAPAA
ncbi:MAG: EAL domain-containing protein [Chloroflexi bacterium]|nr:EAL domain-containing protein [Chloroflexota bacterium]